MVDYQRQNQSMDSFRLAATYRPDFATSIDEFGQRNRAQMAEMTARCQAVGRATELQLAEVAAELYAIGRAFEEQVAAGFVLVHQAVEEHRQRNRQQLALVSAGMAATFDALRRRQRTQTAAATAGLGLLLPAAAELDQHSHQQCPPAATEPSPVVGPTDELTPPLMLLRWSYDAWSQRPYLFRLAVALLARLAVIVYLMRWWVFDEDGFAPVLVLIGIASTVAALVPLPERPRRPPLDR